MKLSIIVPAFNEEATIRRIVARVLAVPLEQEVIVVDDASTDGTWELLQEYADHCILLRHTQNRGKGAAIRTALPWVMGDIVIIQDADLEYDPSEYPRLIQPLLDGQAQVVYGSRLLNGKSPTAGLAFYVGGRFLTWITNFLYGLHITDESTGYKVFRTEVLRGLNLQSNGFEFCPEVTALVALQGIPIVEVPITYRPRTPAEGKKIRWSDGWMALRVLVTYRVAHLWRRVLGASPVRATGLAPVSLQNEWPSVASTGVAAPSVPRPRS
jgi:glycosyltransferase involved in cell wall biosynthesis